jgi:hypothetical protein
VADEKLQCSKRNCTLNLKRFGAGVPMLSATFTDNVDKDEANQYGLITGEIYRKFKDIEVELTKTETE